MATKGALIRIALLFLGIIIPINLLMVMKLDNHMGDPYPIDPLREVADKRISMMIVDQKASQSVYLIPRNITSTSPSSKPLGPVDDHARKIGTLRDSTWVGFEELKASSRKFNVDLWPSKTETNDRILAQLNYSTLPGSEQNVKTIWAYGMNVKPIEVGSKIFERDGCSVAACRLEVSTKIEPPDAIIFKGFPPAKIFSKWRTLSPGAIWIWYNLESPMHASAAALLNGKVNWTANYRRDATIVTPYEKFVPFRNLTRTPKVNHAANKTKLVAWFVSNCKDKNGRLSYARTLSQYIQVDIYGACGNMSCPRRQAKRCFTMLDNDYKFYLSFENSACRDYITEKFFWNALQ